MSCAGTQCKNHGNNRGYSPDLNKSTVVGVSHSLSISLNLSRSRSIPLNPSQSLSISVFLARVITACARNHRTLPVGGKKNEYFSTFRKFTINARATRSSSAADKNTKILLSIRVYINVLLFFSKFEIECSRACSRNALMTNFFFFTIHFR